MDKVEQIKYTVTLLPEARLFRVELILPEPDPEGQVFTLPAWIPGSYMIRDFARNIVSLSAVSAGKPISVNKMDKQTWRAEPVSNKLELKYDVYAADLSVRSAYLNTTRGFFNGTSLFMRIPGRELASVLVEINQPEGDSLSAWKLATTMPAISIDDKGFGLFEVEDYEHLVDFPVELADFQEISYQVNNVPHRMVVTGRVAFDEKRLASDLEKICKYHASLFGELPVLEYLFLTLALADGYGGLEHRNSSSLICRKNDLPTKDMDGLPDGYRDFLGLCSHEYFHLWHVKRIRPELLKQADLTAEVHTRLLWVFEGITSYYDELALVRSGCIDEKSYLQLLAKTVTRVMRGKGRHKQSVAESSFDAWTRFYKQDENSPNAIVSYYAKGALVALGIDVTMRQKSSDTLSLDDLMRLLWERHGKTDIGVTEDGINPLISELTGQSYETFLSDYAEGTKELPLADWFSALGIGFQLRPAKNPEDPGGAELLVKNGVAKPVIGARYKQQGDLVEVTHIVEGGAAQVAGMSAGDRIVAVDSLQVDAGNLHEKISRYEPGDEIEVVAFRKDELMRFRVCPQPADNDTCDLWLLPESECSEAQLARRNSWLGLARRSK